MRATGRDHKASQPTLKLSDSGGATSLQAAGAATLKLPPKAVTNATRKPGMTLQPHQAMAFVNIETVWDAPRAMNQTASKLAGLQTGVDRMQGAFKDMTRTKEEKRKMMDDLHETSLERVEETRQEMEQILADLCVYFAAFYAEYRQKLKDKFTELGVEEERRMLKISKRFQVLEERSARLENAIDEERENRLKSTEDIMGPVRRSVELLVVDLQKERQVRQARHEELTQHMEDSAAALAENLATEQKNREVKHTEFSHELDLDLKRLQNRSVSLEQRNEEMLAGLQEDLANEQRLRKETQDDVVQKLARFIQNFQAHIAEEGQMGN